MHGNSNIKFRIFCRCRLFPSCRAKDLSAPVSRSSQSYNIVIQCAS